jgi:hypothetical protein
VPDSTPDVDADAGGNGDGDADGDYPVPGLPTPDPSYEPGRVVELQLGALASNDEPVEDAGIKTTYNFASPANRRVTGPLDRFARMVRRPKYAPMIDHVEAVAGPTEHDGDWAERKVTVTGPRDRTVTYVFGLSLQDGGPLDGCWLTDEVRID